MGILQVCWSLSYSYTLCWSFSHSSNWYWSLNLIIFLVLVSFLLLDLVLVSFTLLYLVLVFLPNYIPCVGQLLYRTLISFTPLYFVLVSLSTPIPYTKSLSPSSTFHLSLYPLLTLHWYLSHSSTWCWSFYKMLYLVLVSFLLPYRALVSLPAPIPYTGHLSLSVSYLINTLHWPRTLSS